MNLGRRPLFVLDQDCSVLTDRVVQAVEKAGMQTMRSFDLDSLRSSSQGFCCPIHGTSACNCHLVILLIMRRELAPLTLILEGLDHRTSIYLDSEPGILDETVDPVLTAALVFALFAKTNI